MKTTWFSTDERMRLLEHVAGEWIGTPFVANSMVKGKDGGVSCQKLAEAIYRETGFCDQPTPAVDMRHARHSLVSLLESFMDSLPMFVSIEQREFILPGDMLGFKVFRTVHHCGVALSGGRFVHACDGAEVKISNLSDSTWESRLARIWRPVG